MEENKGLLLKSAMTYGLAMGIFWVIKYLFFIFSNTVPALNIIYSTHSDSTVHRLLPDKTLQTGYRRQDQFLSCLAFRYDVVLFCRTDRRFGTFRILPVHRSG